MEETVYRRVYSGPGFSERGGSPPPPLASTPSRTLLPFTFLGFHRRLFPLMFQSKFIFFFFHSAPFPYLSLFPVLSLSSLRPITVLLPASFLPSSCFTRLILDIVLLLQVKLRLNMYQYLNLITICSILQQRSQKYCMYDAYKYCKYRASHKRTEFLKCYLV